MLTQRHNYCKAEDIDCPHIMTIENIEGADSYAIGSHGDRCQGNGSYV